MAIVLAGFLGSPGRAFPDTPQGYRDAQYQFKGEEPRKANFFSIALREYLNDNGRSPERWLILGTDKSIWDALYQAVPEHKRDEPFKEVLEEVADAAREGVTSQDLLDRWGAQLSRLLKIEVVCCLTGNAEEESEQTKVWSAMEQHVKQGDEVIFDITHSLRHFAVISTFSVMLLRELRGIENVDFYYGALELTSGEISHVIHIPICEQLSKASQAIATHKLTGDFRSLGQCLKVSTNFDDRLEKVAYADELNRPEEELAQQLLDEMPNAQNFLGDVLKPRLKQSLEWVAGKGLDRQYRQKAQAAFDCGQYFKAIAYLYEAMLMAQMYFLNKERKDYLDHGQREIARKDLKDRKTYQSLFPTQIKLALDTYYQIEFLRNAVLHGTEAEGRPQSPDVERAIRHAPVLIVMLQNGFILFDELAGLADKENPLSLCPLPPTDQFP